jgi:hypothetical protein
MFSAVLKEEFTVELTSLELDLLQRLAKDAWVSPPLFDRNLVVRLLERGYVRADTLPTGEVRYEITEAGLAGIILDS